MFRIDESRETAGFLRIGDDGFCVLRHGAPTQARNEDDDNSNFFHHSYSSFTA